MCRTAIYGFGHVIFFEPIIGKVHKDFVNCFCFPKTRLIILIHYFFPIKTNMHKIITFRMQPQPDLICQSIDCPHHIKHAMHYGIIAKANRLRRTCSLYGDDHTYPLDQTFAYPREQTPSTRVERCENYGCSNTSDTAWIYLMKCCDVAVCAKCIAFDRRNWELLEAFNYDTLCSKIFLTSQDDAEIRMRKQSTLKEPRYMVFYCPVLGCNAKHRGNRFQAIYIKALMQPKSIQEIKDQMYCK